MAVVVAAAQGRLLPINAIYWALDWKDGNGGVSGGGGN